MLDTTDGGVYDEKDSPLDSAGKGLGAAVSYISYHAFFFLLMRSSFTCLLYSIERCLGKVEEGESTR